MLAIIIIIAIISLAAAGFTVLLLQLKEVREEAIAASMAYDKLLSQKKSSEVRLGQISENLAPFLKDFKYDPKQAHFMGMPVDYVIFTDDEVVFLEVKSGKAQLSPSQRKIKALIKSGKVRWDEMRINDGVKHLDHMLTNPPPLPVSDDGNPCSEIPLPTDMECAMRPGPIIVEYEKGFDR